MSKGRDVVAFSIDYELSEWLTTYSKEQNLSKSYIVKRLLELIRSKAK